MSQRSRHRPWFLDGAERPPRYWPGFPRESGIEFQPVRFGPDPGMIFFDRVTKYQADLRSPPALIGLDVVWK